MTVIGSLIATVGARRPDARECARAPRSGPAERPARSPRGEGLGIIGRRRSSTPRHCIPFRKSQSRASFWPRRLPIQTTRGRCKGQPLFGIDRGGHLDRLAVRWSAMSRTESMNQPQCVSASTAAAPRPDPSILDSTVIEAAGRIDFGRRARRPRSLLAHWGRRHGRPSSRAGPVRAYAPTPERSGGVADVLLATKRSISKCRR